MVTVLVDCDNFFASCERIMQPHLQHVPVAILSNNDGCIIARTQEVKAAGVKMGQPYHECEDTLQHIGAAVFSANFLLYRQCAKRLQTVLRQVPAIDIEVYSIDESFMVIDEAQIGDITEWAQNLQKLILAWTGVPVTIGIARSRALAKVAVHVAKHGSTHVADLTDAQDAVTVKLLAAMPVADVWGVGRRLAPKLRVCGIRTALDLARITPTDNSLKLLNKPGQQLVAELCGWHSVPARQATHSKSMMHTRSFGESITNLADLRSAVGSFTNSLAHKLRRQGLVTGHISVFVRYREQGTDSYGTTIYRERTIAPTQDTFALETTVQALLADLYESNRRYKKAGVVFHDLRPQEQYQISFDQSGEDLEKSAALMGAVDSVADRFAVTLQPAVNYLGSQVWRGKHQHLSPYNHASWDAIPRVVA